MINIETINFDKEKSLKFQLNSLKLLFIKKNIFLGNKFTIEMAILLNQIEKLIGYYDSKKLDARFNSYLKDLELSFSKEDLLFIITPPLLSELNIIKQKFSNSRDNSEKRNVMFELLFFI
jgi:hypothetical protein